MTTAEAVVRMLSVVGIKRAYGIVGGKLQPLLAAMASQNAPQFIGTRHEAAAGMMAAAEAQSSGGIAMAMAELGPGGLNLLAGLGGAFANNLPVLAITSANPLQVSRPSRGVMMDADTAALFAPLTKASMTLLDGRRAPELITRLVRLAQSGRPGPVHLTIPADVMTATHPYDAAAFAPLSDPPKAHPAPDAVTRAADLLAGAKRPVILAGGGASDAAAQIVALGERLGAAMTASQMGLGIVPTDHAQFIGHGGVIGGPAIAEALRGADVVLALGCRLSSWFRDGDGPLLGDATLIHVDTNPEVFGLTVPATVPMLADAGVTVAALREAVGNRHNADPAWLASLRASLKAHQDALVPAQPSTPPHPAAWADALGKMLPVDALVTLDGGHTSFWHNDLLPARKPRTMLHEPGMAQLGFGLPAALALKICHPDQPVICTIGDGSFGFTVQELDTARRLKLPVIVVIHNNAQWGVIATGQKASGFDLGTDLSGTDYAAIARGFGCNGETVTTLEDFATAFARALTSKLPTVLDCRTEFVPHPMMPSFRGGATPIPPDRPL